MSSPSAMRWMRGAAVVGVAAVVLLSFLALTSPVARSLREGEIISGAVLGTDLAEHAPHSDTLMVWFYHPAESRLDVLSVPRDTKIDLPGFRFRRINEVFAYHFGQTRDASLSAGKVCEAVGHLFSRAGSTVRPTYYVQVDYDGFRRVIDRLGGVTVSVDEPMDYDDTAGHFHVHLPTGVVHLSGEKALGFVRFRGQSGDRGRILRQMEFLHALSKRLVSPSIVWRGPRAVYEIFRAVGTNLSPVDLAFFAVEARRLTSQKLNTVLLPGRPRGATWEMDAPLTAYVLSQLEKTPSAEGPPAASPGSSGERAQEPPAGEVSMASATSAPARPVTVKVWNASGRAGVAMGVARRLRAAGFDVVEWGNFNRHQKKTRVVDRSGYFERAGSVAGVLGVTSVYSDMDPSLRTDVDVVLGEDYKPSPPGR